MGRRIKPITLCCNPIYPVPDLTTLLAAQSAAARDCHDATYAELRLCGGLLHSAVIQRRSEPAQGEPTEFQLPDQPGSPSDAEPKHQRAFPRYASVARTCSTLLNFSPASIRFCRMQSDRKAVQLSTRCDRIRRMGNISQSESSGSSLTKNFSIQYRLNNKRILWNKVQVGGTVSWNMNWAEDNNGTPVNNYDLAAEWGRSSPGSTTPSHCQPQYSNALEPPVLLQSVGLQLRTSLHHHDRLRPERRWFEQRSSGRLLQETRRRVPATSIPSA